MLLQATFSCESFFGQREPLRSTAEDKPQDVVVRCLADGLGASGQNQLEFYILARHRSVARGHGGSLSGIRRGELVLDMARQAQRCDVANIVSSAQVLAVQKM